MQYLIYAALAIVGIGVSLLVCRAFLDWLLRFEDVHTVLTFHLSYRSDTGKGYLQTVNEPNKYFAVIMDSGRLGIMKADSIKPYQDFGGSCYSVDFHFTGRYVR